MVGQREEKLRKELQQTLTQESSTCRDQLHQALRHQACQVGGQKGSYLTKMHFPFVYRVLGGCYRESGTIWQCSSCSHARIPLGQKTLHTPKKFLGIYLMQRDAIYYII